VLGEPTDQYGAFSNYEGLSIMGLFGSGAHEEEWADYDNVAIQLDAFDPHLGLFTLNGVPLDMTRVELITILGAPYYDIVDHDHSLIYRVSSPTIEYTVRFWFESPDDDAPVSSVSMFRTAEQHLDVDAPINIAELIGQDFDEHRHLFGNVIGWGAGPATTSFSFDVGISLTTKIDADRPPDWVRDFDIQLEESGWIYTFYVQFDEPENEGLAPFAQQEGFLGYEYSRRFHFNGIGYQSTQADVEAAFPLDSFNRAYVRELNILGDYLLQPTGPPIPREGNVEIAVLGDEGHGWLIGRLDSVIYWNNYFAITFQFSADGKVIDMLVFSDRMI